MPINTGSNPKLLYPGLKVIYGISYSEKPKQCDQIFETMQSRRAYEEVQGMTGFGTASIKTEGKAVTYDTESQAFLTRYTPVVWAMGFIITEENMDDDLYDVIGSRRTKGLAYSMRQTEEIVAANVLNRAFNTSFVLGDASTLVASAGGGGSSSRPNFSGGTWTNGVATATDLSELALEQAKIDIDDYRDDRGKRMQANIKQLIIASSNQFEAERILESRLRSGSAENDVNAMYTMGTIPKVIVNNYLTDADAWFIQTDVPNGFTKMERKAMVFTNDGEFDTSNAKFKVQHRYSIGATDARCVYGSPGA